MIAAREIIESLDADADDGEDELNPHELNPIEYDALDSTIQASGYAPAKHSGDGQHVRVYKKIVYFPTPLRLEGGKRAEWARVYMRHSFGKPEWGRVRVRFGYYHPVLDDRIFKKPNLLHYIENVSSVELVHRTLSLLEKTERSLKRPCARLKLMANRLQRIGFSEYFRY